MAERGSWAVQQVSGVGVQTVEDARHSMAALWTPTGAVTSRSGLVPSGTAAPGRVLATTPTPNGFVHVQPFRYVRQSSRGGGTYTMVLDAIKDLNILGTQAADPSNARIDLIIAQQSDAYFGDANSNMVVKQVVGTASGSPVDPTVTGSADYVLLARVTVPAGATTIQTANIANVALPTAVTVGGLLPIADQTERDAIANPYDGMQVYRRDLDWVEAYDGGAWRAPMWGRTTALANITNPVTGQVMFLTADSFVYRWNGSVWLLMFPASGTVAWGKWGEVKRGTTDNIGSTETMMETLTVTVISGRKYKISWTVGQSSSIGAGPPNATVNIRSKSGGSVATTDTVIRSGNIRVFNGTTEIFEFFATYDAAVSETRTFGISSTSNGAGATQTFNGGNGRCLLIEDIGLT